MSIVGLDAPDFRTVSNFRKRHLKALGRLPGQILQLCEKAGLVKLGHVALDGTKIKANASKHKAMSYERMEKGAATTVPPAPEPVGAPTRVEAMRAKIKAGGHASPYRLRKQLPEPVFGQIKQARGFRQFLLRGFEKVRGEWAIVCSVHNLLKLAQGRTPLAALQMAAGAA